MRYVAFGQVIVSGGRSIEDSTRRRLRKTRRTWRTLHGVAVSTKDQSDAELKPRATAETKRRPTPFEHREDHQFISLANR